MSRQVETPTPIEPTAGTGADDGVEAAAAPSRRGLRRWWIGTLALLVVVGAAIAGIQLSAPKGGPVEPAPPHFSLPRLGGGAAIAYPSAAYARRPVVLTFFASWCTACQAELPMVARVSRALEAEHTAVRFLGVDGNDSPSAGLAFARRSGVPFPAVEDHQETIAYQLGLPGLPDTVFIDRQGKVVHVVEGAVTASTLRHWAGVIAATS